MSFGGMRSAPYEAGIQESARSRILVCLGPRQLRFSPSPLDHWVSRIRWNKATARFV